MKNTIVPIALTAAAFALALPATAHADDRIHFSSPSGNIRCVMAAPTDGPATVAC